LFVQPDRQDEFLRIEGEGGKVINWNGARVFGVLAMSRAIGTLIYFHTFSTINKGTELLSTLIWPIMSLL